MAHRHFGSWCGFVGAFTVGWLVAHPPMGVAGEIVPLSDEYTQAGGIPARLSQGKATSASSLAVPVAPSVISATALRPVLTTPTYRPVAPSSAIQQVLAAASKASTPAATTQGTATAAAKAATVATPSAASTQAVKTAATLGRDDGRLARPRATPATGASNATTPAAATPAASLAGSSSTAKAATTPVGTSATSLARLLMSSVPTPPAPIAPPSTTTATTTKPTLSVSSTTSAFTATTLPPLTQPVKAATTGGGTIQYPSLSGFVYLDTNGNGVKDPGEWAIGGAIVSLHSTTNPGLVIPPFQTGADGSYTFDVPPGTYTITMAIPSDLINALPTVGIFVDDGGNIYEPSIAKSIVSPQVSPALGIPSTDFGTAGTNGTLDQIAGITLGSDYAGLDYNFRELGLQSDMVSKRDFLTSTTTSTTTTTTYWLTPNTPPPVVAEPGTFILLAAGAVCGALIWQRRAKRRKRLAAVGNTCEVMGRARASPWWKFSFGEGRPLGTSARRDH